MGKKKQVRAKSLAAIKQKKAVRIETIQSLLLDTILSEYIQVATVPSGKVVSLPKTNSEGHGSLELLPLCHYERGCPQNFGEFLATAVQSGNPMAPDIAFPWWCRARLRYSCSTIVAAFVRCLIPHLKEMGIRELAVPGKLKAARLNDFEIWTLIFKPRKSHALVFNSFLGSRTEVVEATTPPLSFCSHNVLRNKTTGAIIDITLGQFLGTMESYVFTNQQEFFDQVPGDVVCFQKTDKEAIDQQIIRDNSSLMGQRSPDFKPARFVKRVVRSCQTNKGFCWNCKGIASASSRLKKCSKCKKALYYCRDCQALHWETHKDSCHQVECSILDRKVKS